MRKQIIIICSIILIVLVTFTLKPISIGENPKVHSGKIISISKGGIEDAVFKLQNTEDTFYINRGFQNFKTASLKSLVGKDVVIYYSSGWTPLNPFNEGSKNIEKLLVDNSIFFKI